MTANEPGDLQAIIHQGMQAHHAGNLDIAKGLYRQVLDVEPDHADANHFLGMIAHQTGDHDSAVQLISKAIQKTPNFVAFHGNLGLVLKVLGRTDEAAVSFQKAVDLTPDDAMAEINLADALFQLKRLDEAAAHYQAALAIDAGLPAALNNLGNVFLKQGQFMKAVDYYQKAIVIDAGLHLPHNNLGKALRELGRFIEAADSCRQSLAIEPEYAEAHNNLGIALLDLGQTDDAIASFLQALRINPDFTAVLGNLGAAYQGQGKLEEAADSYHKAIAIDPEYAEAHCKLGNVLADQRKLDMALACYKKTLAIKPGHPLATKSYLYTLLYHPDVSSDDLFDAFKEFIRDKSSDHAKPALPPIDLSSSGRRLRIGYLTSDFRDHPLGSVLMPILSNHDHDRFEIFCYAEMRADDDVTEQFRGHADHWRVINGMTDAEVAANIRDDGIQIMVFLGGHFDGNRPSISSHRAAPVQVSLHGGTTTGLADMDFWMTDAVLHPPGVISEGFTEELFRLPNFYNFSPPKNAPDVSPLPADKNGFITFASFNKPCKMNDQVLDLWSKVLLAVPDSRLMNRSPISDITGNPIHNAWNVVVAPAKGKVSSAMSA